MCEATEVNCPRVFPFAMKTMQWPFEDPAAVSGSAEVQLAGFRRVRDAIEARLKQWQLEIGR